MVFKTIDSSLRRGMSSLGRQSGQGRSLTGQKSGTAGCPGLQPGSVGSGHRRPRSFSSYRSRLLRLLLCSKGKGKGHRSSGRRCLPSELLQATVHLSFALFPCPGPALGTEFLQVFFKVFMVHWSVTGGLTVRLAFQEKLLVSSLQDIQFRVVEFGVFIAKSISFSHISAHSRASFGRKLTVEHDNDTLAISRHDRLLE